MSAVAAAALRSSPDGWPGTDLGALISPEGRLLHRRWLGRIAFDAALELQESLRAALRETAEDVLLLLEHDPVYTTGRGGRVENLAGLREGEDARTPLVRIGRGGDVTYHGPGQLVGYALFDLRTRGGDVHRFLRELESGVIATLAALGVTALRWPSKTGVWVADADVNPTMIEDDDMRRGRVRKIASIGIAVRGGISMHGFALNVAPDLSAFDAIVPCGLGGVHMTSLARETGCPPEALDEIAAVAAREIGLVFTGRRESLLDRALAVPA